MATEERARHELYQRLESTLGEEATSTLMSYLPPVGWADVATKRDLDHHRAATTADLDQHRAATKAALDQLRAEFRADLGELRGEFNQLRSEVQSDIAGLETRLRTEMGSVRHELLAEFHRELTTQTRTLVFSVLGALVGLGGLAIALARLA